MQDEDKNEENPFFLTLCLGGRAVFDLGKGRREGGSRHYVVWFIPALLMSGPNLLQQRLLRLLICIAFA